MLESSSPKSNFDCFWELFVQPLLARLDFWIRIALWCSLVLCPCILAGSLFSGTSTYLLAHKGIRSEGKVTRLVKSQDRENPTVAPVFEFQTPSGKSYTVTSTTGSNPPTYAIGQTVAVLYLPSDPLGARIASFGQLWGLTATLVALGAFFGTLGYALYRYEVRRDSRGEFRLT